MEEETLKPEETPQTPSEPIPEENTDDTSNPEPTTPIENTDPEESPADSSPSLEYEELQKINEKMDSDSLQFIDVNEKLQLIVDELTEEPTPEEIAEEEAQQEAQQKALEEEQEIEQKELEAQQTEESTYQEATLENSQTEIEILQEISLKLSTLQTTSEEQFIENQTMHQNSLDHASDQTWIIVFTLAIAFGFKIFAENLIKW